MLAYSITLSYLVLEKVGIHVNSWVLGDLCCDGPIGIDGIHLDIQRIQFGLQENLVPRLPQCVHLLAYFLSHLERQFEINH